MKRALIFILLISAATSAKAQFFGNPTVSAYISVGSADIIINNSLVGNDVSFNGKAYLATGVSLAYPLSKRFDLVTGLKYSGSFYNYTYIDLYGDEVNSTSPIKVNLISIPVTLKYKLSFMYFTAGVELDQQFNSSNSLIEDQSGIGINLSLGKEFKVSDKFTFYLAPEFTMHNVISFNNQNDKELATLIGIRAGVNLNSLFR